MQDLECSGLEESQLYANGEHVDRQNTGSSILFAAERSGGLAKPSATQHALSSLHRHNKGRAAGSLYKVQYLLAPTLSLATLPRPSSSCIRFRLAPGFCFAAYQFTGNSPSPDKVRLQALCITSGDFCSAKQTVLKNNAHRSS